MLCDVKKERILSNKTIFIKHSIYWILLFSQHRRKNYYVHTYIYYNELAFNETIIIDGYNEEQISIKFSYLRTEDNEAKYFAIETFDDYNKVNNECILIWALYMTQL